MTGSWRGMLVCSWQGDGSARWRHEISSSTAQLLVLLLFRFLPLMHAVSITVLQGYIGCLPPIKLHCHGLIPLIGPTLPSLCYDVPPYIIINSPATRRKASYSPSHPPPRLSASPWAFPCHRRRYGYFPSPAHLTPAFPAPEAKATSPSQPP